MQQMQILDYVHLALLRAHQQTKGYNLSVVNKNAVLNRVATIYCNQRVNFIILYSCGVSLQQQLDTSERVSPSRGCCYNDNIDKHLKYN